jgi:hypothetical protein
MSQALDPSALDTSLRRLRYSALLALAACVVGIGLHAMRSDASDADLDRGFVWVAFGLAAGSILMRRSAASGSPRAFVFLTIGSLLSAVGLGLLGAWLAVRFDQIQPGILYNVAAALLLLRPPGRLVLAPPRGPRV